MEFSLKNKLKLLRNNRDLTQLDVANYLNMTRPGYAHYENGIRNPDSQTLLKLANLYQISVDELVDENDLPIEIAHLYETNPYRTKNSTNDVDIQKNIPIQVSEREKQLITMFRKLDKQDKNMFFNKLVKFKEKK